MDAKLADVINVNNWWKITNKILYNHAANTFPSPKVEIDAGQSLKETWRKLTLPCLNAESRKILFLAIHNKLPVNERLFRIGLNVDPYCQSCMDVDGAVLSDTEHVFSKCVRTKDTWNGIRNLMVELLPSLDSKSDMQLLTLNFPR